MTGPRTRRSAMRWLAAATVLVGVAVGLIALWPAPPPAPIQPVCVATSPTGTYSLDPAQAANATTIAAVAKRLGLADHAVTVAFAAALQESGLRNLDHGDRDSLGLFQQRPSEGWGTPAQIMSPPYASLEFFRHLARIRGWEALPVAEAAQRVQHSAAPDAYADWEDQARVLASVMTGEVPAGLACRYPATHSTPARDAASVAALRGALVAELGRDTSAGGLTEAQGWTMASWIVGHAREFGVRSVTFAGRAWTPSHLSWRSRSPSAQRVQVVPTV